MRIRGRRSEDNEVSILSRKDEYENVIKKECQGKETVETVNRKISDNVACAKISELVYYHTETWK